MKDLIEQLKNNRYGFGLWPEMYGEEQGKAMQEKAKEIGFGEFLYYGGGEWDKCENNFELESKAVQECNWDSCGIYRLRADYTEPVEDEYVLCGIFCENNELCYSDGKIHAACIHFAPTRPNFAGYLYEDGDISPMPVEYTKNDHVYDVVKKGQDFEVIRPTHVVFKKEVTT